MMMASEIEETPILTVMIKMVVVPMVKLERYGFIAATEDEVVL